MDLSLLHILIFALLKHFWTKRRLKSYFLALTGAQGVKMSVHASGYDVG